mmetsp:Transcript_28954/g.60227  ORF Transcript_28954/g.60227 Transcript_28954/m.60227 type:complete len:120 (-) Transcript_28954:2711-3070(-)|eukprot:CAMPEP_0171341242 /NCGR_PEP_ID=MMETSP0878-20121228/9718_1 /TAXON_ID=67004 /ORGANISM="Thalassiosira weissflogii, Strain CCMP1336" /LENGTH=119 /DNA_ID=CAMNT_0011843425 /DNA_START=35 /DNA_END=394 /DNA_ORIENTATION=-
MGILSFLSTPSTNTGTSEPSKELAFIQDEINSHVAVVFSKSYCPFCDSTKQLLNPLIDDLKIIELDTMMNGVEIQNELRRMTGQSTVPNVFIKGEHIGGNDDTHHAYNIGKLQKLLSQK